MEAVRSRLRVEIERVLRVENNKAYASFTFRTDYRLVIWFRELFEFPWRLPVGRYVRRKWIRWREGGGVGI